MKPTNDGSTRRFQPAWGLILAAMLATLLGAAISGCTSEDPNGVGATLVTDQIDTTLVPLGSEEIVHYGALAVDDIDMPVHEQEVLYLGEQNGTRMGPIIANFDFTNLYSADYPETLFTEDHIKNIKYSLTKVEYYFGKVAEDSLAGQPVDLYYQVQEMANLFDPAEYVVPPADSPESVGPILNENFFEPVQDNAPQLKLNNVSQVLEWIANGDSVGIMVSLGAASDPGLVGFASRDLTHYSQLDDLAVGTIVAPNFLIEFNDTSILNLLVEPYEDTSVFEEVPPGPASPDDGLLLRTGLRNYPAMYFDLSALPANAFINRALLSVTNDPTASFGPLSGISVIEWDIVRFENDSIPLDDLKDLEEYYSFYVTGQSSVAPDYHTLLQFDVTQAILRVVNDVYTGTRGFLLTGREQFQQPASFTGMTPDFYYREFHFMGSAAADPADRPQLKITYSLVDEINGEGK